MARENDSNLVIITKYIWIIVSPILILIGTVTNTISVVVLSRKRLMISNSIFYLTILSGANIFMLYIGLLHYWIEHAFQVDIRTLSEVLCRIDVFLVYFVFHFINWTLVTVSIDRCIHVCMPLKAISICTRQRAKIVVSLVAAFFIVFNLHLLWGVHIDVEVGKTTCTGSNYFTNFIWSWICCFTYSIIPFLIMVICNVIMIGRLRKSRRRVASHVQVGEGFRHQTKISAITRTVQLISLTFLILTLPSVIYEVYLPYFPNNSSKTAKEIMGLAKAVVTLLGYTNNVLHFFMFVLSNPFFRRELVEFFKRKQRTVTVDQMQSVRSTVRTNNTVL